MIVRIVMELFPNNERYRKYVGEANLPKLRTVVLFEEAAF